MPVDPTSSLADQWCEPANELHYYNPWRQEKTCKCGKVVVNATPKKKEHHD